MVYPELICVIVFINQLNFTLHFYLSNNQLQSVHRVRKEAQSRQEYKCHLLAIPVVASTLEFLKHSSCPVQRLQQLRRKCIKTTNIPIVCDTFYCLVFLCVKIIHSYSVYINISMPRYMHIVPFRPREYVRSTACVMIQLLGF